MQIRRIRRGEGPALREIRLRALAMDPDAFGSSLAREEKLEMREWDARAREAAKGTSQFLAVADGGERFLGMAGAFQPDRDPDSRHLTGMWVEPESRSVGVGGELVRAVQGWCAEVRASRISLWVVETNATAISLDRRKGFVPTGETQALPSNPALTEIEMALSLQPG